jgi:hypothetical protein
MIRPAKLFDVPALVELGREMHLESRFAGERYGADKVEGLLTRLISGDGVVFVAEHDGEIVGGFAGGTTDRWFNDTLVAFDYGLFVRRGERHGIIAMKLVSAFMRWAHALGVTTIECGVVSGVNTESTARMYEALGLKRVGVLLEAKV